MALVSIQASVGINSPNLLADVMQVQTLLNQVAPTDGGPVTPLVVDGKCGTKTLAAIQRFQQTIMNFPDGRIEPNKKTWQKLVGVTGMDKDPYSNNEYWTWKERRMDIIYWAKHELGKVSDRVPLPDPKVPGHFFRRGGDVLKVYFEQAVMGWHPAFWQGKGNYNGRIITAEEGVLGWNQRVPQPMPPGAGINWCGIFATWVWRQAGLYISWIPGIGINMDSIDGYPLPGDIIVEYGAANHHAIVTSTIGDDDKYETVNGNAEYQEIRVLHTHRKKIAKMYSVNSYSPLYG